MPKEKRGYPVFPPIQSPQYTPVPDFFFDTAMSHLNLAQTRIYLFICRKTFGWKKEYDDISISQIVWGTGLKEPTVKKETRNLCQMGLICRKGNSSQHKGSLPSTYSLNMVTSPINIRYPQEQSEQVGVSHEIPGGVSGETPHGGVSGETPTINTNINKQQHVVVALLNKYGLSRNIAQKFANTYDAVYIEQKVAYLAYNLTYAPENVKKPAAWLRRAIEQDWAAPDGYRTPEQIAAEKAQLTTAQQRQQQADQIKQQQQAEQQAEKEREWEAARHFSRTHFGTSEAEITLWQQVLIDLKPQLAYNIYPLLENGELLAIQEKTAVIGVLFPLHQGIVADKARHQLLSSFSYLSQDVDDIKVVVLGDVDSTPANGTQSSLVVATVASSENSD